MVTWDPYLWIDRMTDTRLKTLPSRHSVGGRKNYYKTRMHSSRMHTAHSLTMGGGFTCLGCVPVQGGVPAWEVYLPRGCTCRGLYLPRGVPSLGSVYLPGDVPARGYLPRYSPLPPWTEFLTHATENITLPQLRCGR